MLNFKTKMLATLAKFSRDQRGVAAIVAAVALPALMGTVGLAVDSTRYFRAKQIVIDAADQAALSAAAVDVKAGGETREQIAAKFFKANIPTDFKDIVDLKGFTFTDDSASATDGTKNGAVIINYKVEAGIKPLVAQVVGVDFLNLTHNGQAMREIQSLEVVLNLPMSGTMCSTKSRAPSGDAVTPGDTLIKLRPDADCKHFNAMKKGVQVFADTLFDNQSVSRLKLGMVPYGYKVKMPDVRNIPPLMLEKELNADTSSGKTADPEFFSNLSDVAGLPPVTALTTDRNKVNTAIKELSLTPAAAAWSRTNLPTLVSGLMLDPTQHAYFSPGIKPEEFTNTTVQKIVVLMTDGSNIGCCYTAIEDQVTGKVDFTNQYVYFHTPDNAQQLKYCELLKQDNVKIYSIIFDVNETDSGGKQINNIFARCASGSYSDASANVNDERTELLCKNKQNCYNVSNDEQLSKVFKDIANNFFVARTSK